MPAVWRPLYLRLSILVAFCIAFAALIPTLEVLLIISNRDKGLATAQQRFEYVWKYGPTALLTIITLTWDRVTFQIQMLAPWHRMAKSNTLASDGILLDYLNMFPPVAIIQALKRRDWAPAAALSASLVLQVIVTLSTSLIDLRVIELESLVPIELKTRFNNDADSLESDLRLAHFTMAGISDLRFPYPKGTTAQYAYQAMADPIFLGTSVRLNVDGFVATLDCNNAEIKLLEASAERDDEDFGFHTTFEIRSMDCLMIITTNVGHVHKNFTSVNFVRMLTGSCDSPTIAMRERMSIIVGRIVYTVDSPDEAGESNYRVSNIKLANSGQAMCVPRYDIRKVNFIHHTTSAEEVSSVQDINPRTLNKISAWDFVLAQIGIIDNSTVQDQIWGTYTENGLAISFDNFAASARSSELVQVPYAELTDFTPWRQAIPAYFRKFSAQIAERSLLEPSPEVVMGNRSQFENRLIISGPICHTMAALLALCILHCAIIVFTLPRDSQMPTNPTSVLGTAWMAIGATSLLLRLRDQGLGPADLHQYIQYSWTVVPSIFFTAIALMAGSIDGATRSLQPFLAMKRGGSFPKTLDLDFLDGSLPRMLLSGLRTRTWPSVFAITAFLVSSVFMIFSGSLYINQYTPIRFATTLRANTTFGSRNNVGPSWTEIDDSLELAASETAVASSLIIGRNGSFPPFIYKDLAFPSLVLDKSPWIGIPEYDESNSSALEIVAEVPAVRSRLHCNIYSGDQIRTNLTMNYTTTGLDVAVQVQNPLRIDIDGEGCFIDASVETSASTVIIPTPQESVKGGEMTFGSSSGDNLIPFPTDSFPRYGLITGCDLVTYVWGHVAFDPKGKNTVNAFALGCNETLEIVNTKVHFKSASLIIDTNQPPVPDETSSQRSILKQRPRQALFYKDLVQPKNADPSQLLSPFFSHLVLSQRTILASDLANATAVEKVAAAIRAQHELISSVAIDQDYRLNIDNSSLDEARPGARVSPRTFLYAANASILPGRLRVMQDIWPTRVLQGLLAATLASSLMAWWFMPRTDVIVGSPTNIARKLALAAGGNLFEEVLSCDLMYEEIDRMLKSSDRIFTIGWRSPAGSTGKERYGIWVLSPDEMEELRQGEVKEASWIPWKRWRWLGSREEKTEIESEVNRHLVTRV
ncbi:hypothetical protein O1611_g2713 [Lasiodiplodia mahajangana]|uniref:Uncharacterized protein n=1 Tax=Lasiodiplodia mahajangana TaxID=1108764 RepID=A0ACC2JTU7_9PEZI|nr:hypothetical protein O1611_g2713 [Lasiodiplodia mahajangana]